jgi:hypothetical protein
VLGGGRSASISPAGPALVTPIIEATVELLLIANAAQAALSWSDDEQAAAMRERGMLIDCAVVGAGPAGLATSAALTARGVEHVVLERGRVGESWRTQRWDSFRLNTPGWMNQLLGEQARDSYATGVEVVQRLEKLAANCPVREGVQVAGWHRPATDTSC